MKKVLLNKSNSTDVVENTNKNMYIKRKAMQTAYQDLFQALLRLPDKQVQARVLDAINGSSDRMDKRKTVAEEIIQTCDQCKGQKTKIIFVDSGTQTTISTINEEKDIKIPVKISNEDSIPTLPSSSSIIMDEMKSAENKVSIKDEPKKRKQQRKVRAPQVVKQSLAKQLQQKQQSFIQKRKSNVLKLTDETEKTRQEASSPTSKRQRSDSISSIDIEEANRTILLWHFDRKAIMEKTMLEEFRKAEIKQADGLIPIHSAIMNDNLIGVKLQIFVWKKLKKVELNELCTDDDEDCLQLAIIQNKSNLIVDELIKNGLDLNSLDSQSNNLIHLAVINEIDIENFQLLLNEINLEILFKLNDDGFTPLHLAVRQDNYLMTEVMLNTIDKRCFGRFYYERESINGKEGFLNYYEKCCEHLEFENSMLQESKEQQKIKRRLLDTGDMRSGNTALFYSIENKFEHLIYLLLAHFSDPRVENHSGHTPRAYVGEFGRTLNLSLKIDRTMEKIEYLLNK